MQPNVRGIFSDPKSQGLSPHTLSQTGKQEQSYLCLCAEGHLLLVLHKAIRGNASVNGGNVSVARAVSERGGEQNLLRAVPGRQPANNIIHNTGSGVLLAATVCAVQPRRRG